MEIQALKLYVTESDVNELVSKYLPGDQPLEKLVVRILPEGVSVSGEYPLLVRVGFETLWELEARDGKVLARLSSLKAMGLPATVFKGMVLKAIEDAVEDQDWLIFDEDTMMLDLDHLLAGEGLHLKTNLRAVHTEQGALIIEAARN